MPNFKNLLQLILFTTTAAVVSKVYVAQGRERGDSRGAALGEALGHGHAEGVIGVEHAPGGLQDRVEQTVAGRAVPQRVQMTGRLARLAGKPVDGHFFLQLCAQKQLDFSFDDYTVLLCEKLAVGKYLVNKNRIKL